jgi:hypothetical protein
MTRVAKWKAIIMGRDGLRGSWGKKVFNGQIFIVGHLQFLERERQRERERERSPVRDTVFNSMFQQWSGNTGSCTRVVSKHTIQNGSVQPPASATKEMGEMCRPRK